MQVVEDRSGYSWNATTGAGTRVFVSAEGICDGNATAVELPAYGDAWDSMYTSVICSQISEQKLTDTVSRYTCTYQYNAPTRDYVGSLAVNKTLPSISGTSEANTYTYPTGAQIYYGPGGSGFTLSDEPITTVSLATIMTVSATVRWRGTVAGQISVLKGYLGHVNDSAMWGVKRGCVLCTGASLTPLEEVVSGTKQLTFNRTLNFSIRLLPAGTTLSDEDSWQYVYCKGSWCRLATDSEGSHPIKIYEYATLPSDLE